MNARVCVCVYSTCGWGALSVDHVLCPRVVQIIFWRMLHEREIHINKCKKSVLSAERKDLAYAQAVSTHSHRILCANTCEQ